VDRASGRTPEYLRKNAHEAATAASGIQFLLRNEVETRLIAVVSGSSPFLFETRHHQGSIQ
jgi:hypothetical protein